MDLKISLKSQLYALRELLIISIVYFGLIYFLYLNAEFDLFKILFLSTFAFYFIVLLLPVMVLHINYLNNTYKHLRVEQNKLTINNAIYTENEIDKIKIYATSQHFSDSVGVSALPYNDYYYYIKVDLKNGEKINLSSLIDYKIDKIITENFKTIGIIEQPSTFVMLLTK
ncbi:hypothetical protein EIB75_13095 [Epilithonimonas vandammei]|uniref:PH domain-containing protein n=1 Tax=Epilithonimonas vandammei TaxID=2487072 RepID=A0A3G8ZQ47_9FLAO|nr:hypothetical protein [Epilithonimonas vandammei]AZI56136.1 hypothetical protein EIB75_13095 [Epilithonimonas vandammei]